MSNDTRGGASLAKVASIFLFLFLFLLAIQLLGDSFKLLGERFSIELVKTTSEPLIGLFVGILATVLVQSSSVTTSVIVGLVSGGALTVASAVPMIMGANIGTTVTNTLVSLGHVSRKKEFERAFAGSTMHDFFNLLTVAIVLPLELTTHFLARSAAYVSQFFYGMEAIKFQSPVKALVKPPAKLIKHYFVEMAGNEKIAGIIILILALVLIFSSLYFLVKLLRSSMVQRVKVYIDKVFGSGAIITMFIGMMVTIMVQSSSITTSIMIPLMATGILSLEHAFPLTLGANVGTTVTALLAALVGNIAGLTIALVHLMFNVVGIILIYPVPAIRRIPIQLARSLARMAVRNRILAVVYVLVVFVLVPLTCVVVSRLG